MNERVKLTKKNFFLGILIIFILVSIIFFIVIYIRYKSSKDYAGNYFDSLYYEIKNLYEFKPSFFEFDENGIAIVTVDDLLLPITNGDRTMQVMSMIVHNENQDECVGYIIVEKLNNDLKVDTSYICDMIDY